MSQFFDAAIGAVSQHTLKVIFQQPALWPTTLERVRRVSEQLNLPAKLNKARVLLAGAGTSAYAGGAIADAWPGALAVPTTDLLVDSERYLLGVNVMISIARSGNSPESEAVVKQVRISRPDILQLAIVCNQESALSGSGLDGLIVLDPRTNDQSMVMTSSFSNLVMAGMSLALPDAVSATAAELSLRTNELLPGIDQACRNIATRVKDRIVVLSSSPLLSWGREAGLKALEITAGRFPVITETYLGLRHGPISFLNQDTLVLCLLSSDPLRRRYEEDLIRELRTKNLGYLVGIVSPHDSDLFDQIIPAIAPRTPDFLRTPYEIVIPQLLGYHLSLLIGMNPDNPSPGGVINRVVQGVTIHTA